MLNQLSYSHLSVYNMPLSAVLSYRCVFVCLFFDGATVSKQNTVSTTCHCLLSWVTFKKKKKKKKTESVHAHNYTRINPYMGTHTINHTHSVTAVSVKYTPISPPPSLPPPTHTRLFLTHTQTTGTPTKPGSNPGTPCCLLPPTT